MKGGENTETSSTNHYSEKESIILAIKFYDGENVKIKCSDYMYDKNDKSFKCFDSNKEMIFFAPIERILCAYDEKFRIYK